ncbi:hypothetical protein BJX99DRAFT_216024 [Aspergillus californicus]
MTMYGMTFNRSYVYTCRKSAMASLCREALRKLKVEFPDWIIPERPSNSSLNPRWDWVEILRDYCVHQSWLEPRYTEYAHYKGYRHEVQVDGAMYFGPSRYYPDERSSKQGAAHVALYDLIVHGDCEGNGCQGPPTLKASNEALLSLVPRDPLHRQTRSRVPTVPQKRTLDDQDDFNVKKRPRSSRSSAVSSGVSMSISRNANLQPLENSRITAIVAPVIEEKRRWRVTPSEISRQLQSIKAWIAKLQKICELLSLERPEYHIERADGRLIDTEGEYTAAVYFKNDPFLARAGAIGRVQAFSGTRDAVHEACAREASAYLIKMVEEDTTLENTAAEERNAMNRWGETAGM